MVNEQNKEILSGVHFWQGDIACAEGAIAAGCRFFAGYPITPASEIAEHMAKRLPEVGGIYVQMEDEIASISAIIGASWGGLKAMTATSGPGFSLMQENIGYACMTETPCVIVDVQRVGPSTGQATKAAQGDAMQARWGTHGDHEVIVLSPNSPQEMFDLTIKAFNLSELYRVPVIVLADEMVGHMWEKVRVPSPEEIEIWDRKKPSSLDEPVFGGVGEFEIPPMPRMGDGYNLLITGSTHDEYGYRKTVDPEAHRKLVTRIINKIRKNVEKIIDVEIQNIEDADIGIISFGCTSRSVYDVIELAKKEGITVGHVRLRTIWPFPEKIVRKMAERVDFILVPEMNLGQLVYEVERVVCCEAHVKAISKIGGGEMITPEEIFSEIKRFLRRRAI